MFRRAAVALLLVSVPLASCGGGDDDIVAQAVEAGASGLPVFDSPRLVGTAGARSMLAARPVGMVVLDVRTPEEFATGYLDGAVMIDFQAPTFVDEVSRLDRDAPILLYCRSGNRSADAVAAMVDLGFTDITELDGGVIAWQDAGLPLVTD